MIYTIRKTFKYTEIVEVNADNYAEALELANYTDGDVQNDDWLYDAEVIKGESGK
jgi:GTPase Era involved in 16S rRNA processing